MNLYNTLKEELNNMPVDLHISYNGQRWTAVDPRCFPDIFAVFMEENTNVYFLLNTFDTQEDADKYIDKRAPNPHRRAKYKVVCYSISGTPMAAEEGGRAIEL